MASCGAVLGASAPRVILEPLVRDHLSLARRRSRGGWRLGRPRQPCSSSTSTTAWFAWLWRLGVRTVAGYEGGEPVLDVRVGRQGSIDLTGIPAERKLGRRRRGRLSSPLGRVPGRDVSHQPVRPPSW